MLHHPLPSVSLLPESMMCDCWGPLLCVLFSAFHWTHKRLQGRGGNTVHVKHLHWCHSLSGTDNGGDSVCHLFFVNIVFEPLCLFLFLFFRGVSQLNFWELLSACDCRSPGSLTWELHHTLLSNFPNCSLIIANAYCVCARGVPDQSSSREYWSYTNS